MIRFLRYLPLILLFAAAQAQEVGAIGPSSESTRTSTAFNLSALSPGEEQTQYIRSGIYFQFSASALFASLSDWKNQPLFNGAHPSSMCTVFGIESGCVLNSYLGLGAGYEFFFTSKATVQEIGDQVNCTFFYGSLKAGSELASAPDLYLYGALDVGTLGATEAIENSPDGSFNNTGGALAFRLKTGAQYYSSESWSLILEAGYFSGNVKQISAFGSIEQNYSLNLSGVVFRFAVGYHIPF